MLLKLDVNGSGVIWEKPRTPDEPPGSKAATSSSSSTSDLSSSTPPSPASTPSRKRMRDEVWCEWCNQKVTTHYSENCKKNLANKAKGEQEKEGKDGKKQKKS